MPEFVDKDEYAEGDDGDNHSGQQTANSGQQGCWWSVMGGVYVSIFGKICFLHLWRIFYLLGFSVKENLGFGCLSPTVGDDGN